MIPSSQPEEQWSVFVVAQMWNVFVSVGLVVVLQGVSTFNIISSGIEFHLFVGAVVALTGLTNASVMLLLQNEKYAVRTGSFLLRSVVTIAAQIALGLVGSKQTGLIEGFCIGFVAQALLLIYALSKLKLDRHISRMKIMAAVSRYSRMVLFDIPSTLISALSINAMSVLISLAYSMREVGLYSISFRIAALPLSLVATGLSEVYFQKASASRRNSGDFLWEFKFTLWAAIALSAIVVAVYGLSSNMITRILGEKWVGSQEIVLILLPLLTARLVAVSVQTTALVFGKPRWLLGNNIVIISVMVLSFGLSVIFQYDFEKYLLVNSVGCSAAYWCFLVFLYIKVAKYHAANAGRER